ncbi:MAG: DUF4397 domain-containing protein [Capsulimonadaceae bacterium]|nr:DUF4397 domain-containing protein [Capsulimonadaceae bacterium]
MTRNLLIGAKICALASGLALATLIGGCSGSSSSGTVDIRTVDAVSNGNNATIEINNGTVSGSQTFFSVSAYHYMQPSSAVVTFSFSDITTTFQSTGYTVAAGNSYTVYVVGDTNTSNPQSADYPQAVFLNDDQTGTSSGKVLVRFIMAAPSIASATINVNGSAIASGLKIGAATSYATYTGSSPSVSVTSPSGSVLVPAAALNLSGGHSYTLVLDEPTIGSGTYRFDAVLDH